MLSELRDQITRQRDELIEKLAKQTFSSTQCYLNRYFSNGGSAPVVRSDRLGPSISGELSEQEIDALECGVCKRRNSSVAATNLINIFGKEILCCELHTDRARQKYQNIDKVAWFIKQLEKPAFDPSDIGWIFVTRTPPSHSADYSALPWVWYTDRQYYTIYRNEPRNPPSGVYVKPIRLEDAHKLCCQIMDQAKKNRPVFVIGFVDDHPFKTPDFSHGYSIEPFLCDECPEKHIDSWFFQYEETPSQISIDSFRTMFWNQKKPIKVMYDSNHAFIES